MNRRLHHARTPQEGHSMCRWVLEDTSEDNPSEGVASSHLRKVGISCTRQGGRQLEFEPDW